MLSMNTIQVNPNPCGGRFFNKFVLNDSGIFRRIITCFCRIGSDSRLSVYNNVYSILSKRTGISKSCLQRCVFKHRDKKDDKDITLSQKAKLLLLTSNYLGLETSSNYLTQNCRKDKNVCAYLHIDLICRHAFFSQRGGFFFSNFIRYTCYSSGGMQNTKNSNAKTLL